MERRGIGCPGRGWRGEESGPQGPDQHLPPSFLPRAAHWPLQGNWKPRTQGVKARRTQQPVARWEGHPWSCHLPGQVSANPHPSPGRPGTPPRMLPRLPVPPPTPKHPSPGSSPCQPSLHLCADTRVTDSSPFHPCHGIRRCWLERGPQMGASASSSVKWGRCPLPTGCTQRGRGGVGTAPAWWGSPREPASRTLPAPSSHLLGSLPQPPGLLGLGGSL